MRHTLVKNLFRITATLVVVFAMSGVYAHADDTATGLFFKSTKTKVSVGDGFSVDVLVRSPGTAINAVSGSVAVPAGIVVDSVSTSGSIITFWTKNPTTGSTIPFEGVVVGAPYQGKNGVLFHIVAHAKKAGTIAFHFNDGTVLTGDGTATNILSALDTYSIAVATPSTTPVVPSPTTSSIPLVAQNSPFIQNVGIPYITSYTPVIDQMSAIALLGKGTPGAVTQIDFVDASDATFGRTLIHRLEKDRVLPEAKRVVNNPDGTFSMQTASNLVAGSYMAVPSLVNDKNEVIPGTSILVMVKDNIVIRLLIIVVNALLIIVPIVGLLCLIVYIPWYIRRRMRLTNKRFELAEEKIEEEEKDLAHGHHDTTRKSVS